MPDLSELVTAVLAVLASVFAAILAWIKFVDRPIISIEDTDANNADADYADAAREGTAATRQTAASVSEQLELSIAEINAAEAEAVAASDKSKQNIKNASTDKLREYLESEGYNVNDIWPED